MKKGTLPFPSNYLFHGKCREWPGDGQKLIGKKNDFLITIMKITGPGYSFRNIFVLCPFSEYCYTFSLFTSLIGSCLALLFLFTVPRGRLRTSFGK
jgi:hypothetical protein